MSLNSLRNLSFFRQTAMDGYSSALRTHSGSRQADATSTAAVQPRRNGPVISEPSLKVLILTVRHGAGHARLAGALRRALLHTRPESTVEIVDGLEYCAPWFRFYYDSYQIPLKYWPSFWKWIENIQHTQASTGPGWLYRVGAQPLLRFIRNFCPDVIVATEVGMCELAAMIKSETGAAFALIAAPTLDVDRAWIQTEVDLYLSSHSDVTEQLLKAGASAAKIALCGMIVDPAFDSASDRALARSRLFLHPDLPLPLVLFGGAGYGSPSRMLAALKAVRQPFNAMFIAGMNGDLYGKIWRDCADDSRFRVCSWVNNIHEWMAAADLLLSKPGEMTVCEAIASGLPLLAFDPLPGAEQRTCALIEKWRAGCWVRRPEDLGGLITRLLANRAELRQFREQVSKLASPRGAFVAAEAILKSVTQPS